MTKNNNPMGKKSTYDDITNIIDRFDFEKVRSFMVINKWYWRDAKQAPSIDELRATAFDCLRRAVDDPAEVTNSGTGGFMAYKMPWGLSLHFSVETRSTY